MKQSSTLRLLFAASVAMLMTTSCATRYSTPERAASRASQSIGTVFSYNDRTALSGRTCEQVGVLPLKTQRALVSWLKKSELKKFDYIYPQYFVEMTEIDTNRPRVWALCSDGRGNLVGIFIPKGNIPAWELSNTGDYELYVCQGSSRDALSSSIMTSLAEAGYDKIRIDAKRATGLTEDRYLISKPAKVVAPVAAPAAATPAKAAPAVEVEEDVEEEATEASDSFDNFEGTDDEIDFGL